MEAKVRLGRGGGPTAPATLLGHNLEAAGDSIPGMLSDRLDNPKFLGPGHPGTGIAPGWQPLGNSMPGMHCRVTEGMGMSGREAQFIHAGIAGYPNGILQTGRSVRKGEKLEVEVWAKALHKPLSLIVGVGPLVGQLFGREKWYGTATLNVDAAYWKRYSAVVPVPRDDDEAVFYCLVDGEGDVWLDQVHLRPAGEGPLCGKLRESILSLGVPALRFPGGSETAVYRWKHGTGPMHLRPVMPDPVFQWHISYDFGTDEYLQLCSDLGIGPHVTLNIGTGTPGEAEDWAAYCAEWFRVKSGKLPTAYFQMGNEQNMNHETAHMTGEMYVEALREFVPGVRRAWPGARIIALGEKSSSGIRPGEATLLRGLLLEKVPGLFDLLAVHHYTGGIRPGDDGQMADVVESIGDVGVHLREAAADIAKKSHHAKVALTEYNYWLDASHWDGKGFLERYDARHAMFVAGMLAEMTRQAPAVELANFYHLVNVMGVLRHRGAAVEETCLADVFRLHRPAFPGEVLPLEVSSPALGGGSAVDGICLRNGEGMWLFLANRSATSSAGISLEGLAENADGSMLSGTSPVSQMDKAGAGIRKSSVELPPLSLVRFNIR